MPEKVQEEIKVSQESFKKPPEKKDTRDKLAELTGAKSSKKKKGLGNFFKSFFG
jgi:hypothetical protein